MGVTSIRLGPGCFSIFSSCCFGLHYLAHYLFSNWTTAKQPFLCLFFQQVWFQNRRAKWRRQEKMESASLKLPEHPFPPIRGNVPPQASLAIDPWIASSISHPSPLARYSATVTSAPTIPINTATLPDRLPFLNPSAISFLNPGHIPFFPSNMNVTSNYLEDTRASNLSSLRLSVPEPSANGRKYNDTEQGDEHRWWCSKNAIDTSGYINSHIIVNMP